MTASEDSNLDSLKKSTERIVTSVVMLGAKVITDPRIAGPAEKVQRELRQAKAVGQFTVLSAAQKLKRSLEHEPAAEEPKIAPSETTATKPTAPGCIPDYVNLSASQIVPLTRALSDEEKQEVLAYESATRQRKTILSALHKPTA